MKNQVVWVDIPVVDLDRAIRFYAAVLGDRVERVDNDDVSIGRLPDDGAGSSGTLYVDDDYTPTADGPLVYLNVAGRMDKAELAADRHGGKIIEPPHELPGFGRRMILIDPEGNRIALLARTG